MYNIAPNQICIIPIKYSRYILIGSKMKFISYLLAISIAMITSYNFTNTCALNTAIL